MTKKAILLLAAGLLVLGCGGAAESEPLNSPANASKTAPTAADVPMPPGTLKRSAVKRILAQGPGAFLQRVTLDTDHPVFKDGKFHGFRIVRLNGEGFWDGVDLVPGDVVTRVNGFPLERPEHALEAFKSVDTTEELRVTYERNGEVRLLKYKILDDAPPGTPPASTTTKPGAPATPPPAAQPPAAQPKK